MSHKFYIFHFHLVFQLNLYVVIHISLNKSSTEFVFNYMLYIVVILEVSFFICVIRSFKYLSKRSTALSFVVF